MRGKNVLKNAGALLIVLLMVLSTLVVTANTINDQPKQQMKRGHTWYVDGNNWQHWPGNGSQGNPFCGIQYAIDNAVQPGDTVLVAPYNYVDDVLIGYSKTPMNLIGANKDTTIIDWGGPVFEAHWNVIQIGFDETDENYITGVNISGFTIRNAECDGISVYAKDNINISNNIITNNGEAGIAGCVKSHLTISENEITENGGEYPYTGLGGIDFFDWSSYVDTNNCVISNNLIEHNSGSGISIIGDNGLISNNSIRYNKDLFHGSDGVGGIYLASHYTDGSENWGIYSNIICNNAVDGVYIDSYYQNINIVGNSISSNDGDGVNAINGNTMNISDNFYIGGNRNGSGVYVSGENVYISRNKIEANGVGIDLAASNSTVYKNDFHWQQGTGLYVSGSYNLIFNNNFDRLDAGADNPNAYDAGTTNRWNYTYPVGGNWWDDKKPNLDYWSAKNQDNDFNGNTYPDTDGYNPDGIIDHGGTLTGKNPYTQIEGGSNKDWYPLTHFVTIRAPIIYSDPDFVNGNTTGRINVTIAELGISFFIVNFGDGTLSGWIGPYNTGDVAQVNHVWTTPGVYGISAQAKDIAGTEGNWSDPNPVYVTQTAILVGLISDRNNSTGPTNFHAKTLLWIGLNPFSFNIYKSNEQIIISDEYNGFLGKRFILGQFNAVVVTNDHDVGVTEIISPTTGPMQTYPVEVTVKNFGINSETGVPVNMVIEKGGVVDYNQTVIIDIGIGATLTVAFPDWTPSDIGEYHVTACTQLATDTFASNDCMSKVITIT